MKINRFLLAVALVVSGLVGGITANILNSSVHAESGTSAITHVYLNGVPVTPQDGRIDLWVHSAYVPGMPTLTAFTYGGEVNIDLTPPVPVIK